MYGPYIDRLVWINCQFAYLASLLRKKEAFSHFSHTRMSTDASVKRQRILLFTIAPQCLHL